MQTQKENFIKIDCKLLSALNGNYEATALMQYIYSMYLYWKKENKLVENNYFFLTVDNVEKNLLISKYKQQKILEILQSSSFIKIEYRGLPRKRYIAVNEVELEKIFIKKEAKKVQEALQKRKISREEKKKIFYKNLNDALNSNSYKDIYTHAGNISNDLLMAIYMWKQCSLSKGISWELNARDLGILKYWVQSCYKSNQPVNFAKILYFFHTFAKKDRINTYYFSVWARNCTDFNQMLRFNNIKEINEFLTNKLSQYTQYMNNLNSNNNYTYKATVAPATFIPLESITVGGYHGQ